MRYAILALALFLICGCEFSKDRGVKREDPEVIMQRMEAAWQSAFANSVDRFADMKETPENIADAVLADCEPEWHEYCNAARDWRFQRTGMDYIEQSQLFDQALAGKQEKARREVIRRVLLIRAK